MQVEKLAAWGHKVKRKHSEESLAKKQKNRLNLLLLIWAEVRWCSAASDGRSGRSCWRDGSCSPPLSWARGRPGRWGAAGAAGRGALPWRPVAGRTGSLRRRTVRRRRLEGQNGRKRSQRRLAICSGCGVGRSQRVLGGPDYFCLEAIVFAFEWPFLLWDWQMHGSGIFQKVP